MEQEPSATSRTDPHHGEIVSRGLAREPGSSATIEHIAARWHLLQPHIKDAILTLVEASATVSGKGDVDA